MTHLRGKRPSALAALVASFALVLFFTGCDGFTSYFRSPSLAKGTVRSVPANQRPTASLGEPHGSPAEGSSGPPGNAILRGHAMGTTWRVLLPRTFVPLNECDECALQLQIDTTLEDLESQLSHWRDDSLVSRFNQSKSIKPFEVTAELAHIIATAQQAYTVSGGAFDITSAPMINLWGFGPDGHRSQTPSQGYLDDALQHIGTRHLALSQSMDGRHFLCKRTPQIQIDLSALAKGYAIDMIAEQFEAQKIDGYLIELGGELRARGTKSDGTCWQVGLEQPHSGTFRRIRRSLPLQDQSIATSGSYRNFVRDKLQEKTYSHIIDPRTGHPVAHRLVSVSVIDDCAMWADAWATAFMVLGPEQGFALAEEQGLGATFITASAEGFSERSTKAFRDLTATPTKN